MPDGKEGYAFYRNNLSVIASQCHCPGCGTQQPQHFACVLLAAALTEAPLQGELAGASPTERLYEGEALSLPQYLHLRPSPDRLGGINLRPAGAEGVSGGFGLGFGA